MKVRVIDKPCLFAETVYLLYYYINGIAYTRDYERVNRKFGRYLLEKEDQGLQLAQELDRISAAVTQTLDPHQARLRYFFEKLPGTDEKTCCCLAHTMLVATPLNCTDIDSFAAELLRTTTLRVQDIAAGVGYESQGKFAKAFYDQFRLMPMEYRRLAK